MDYSAIHQHVQEEFQCDHPSAIVTRFVKSNGTVEFRSQCQACGQGVKAIRKSELTRRQMDEAPAFDSDLKAEWYRRRDELFRELQAEAMARDEAERGEADRAWWDRYHRHLNSVEWAWRRNSVLRRAGYTCEGCLNAKATQVHHLSYDMLGRELLFDLVALCERCHDAAHGRKLRGQSTPPTMPDGYRYSPR